MLFNSLDFAIFLPIVFLIYWFAFKSNPGNQNRFLLLASYFFYGWWDWRFLLLLIFISLFNYFVGIRIDTNEIGKRRKLWLVTGLFVNIGVLIAFKYYNFFIDSFLGLISLAGYELQGTTIKIILPLGISFYIFLSLSYLLDIYKKNLIADRNIVRVLLSLGFFPIILAGPIQRPSSLLPQIANKREFNYDQAVDGLRQILWGLFMKIGVADNIAPHVDDIFSHFSDYSGSTLFLGSIFYSIQIYADFAGYSNIAIGTAKLFGFTLMRNFAYPYFSRDISEFWKKWHISLTSWFRDYLFLPISFAVSGTLKHDKVGFIKTDLFIYIIASLITWFLTGLWHGANYTFIAWGMIHGFFLIIYQWQKKPRKRLFKQTGMNNNSLLVIFVESFITLLIVVISWVVFRSDTIQQSVGYIKGIFSPSLFSLPQVLPKTVILISAVFLLVEYVQRKKQHGLQLEKIKSGFLKWGIYLGLVLIILLFGGGSQKFIYFQF
jgi:D-alanyl-lipoteichoic acid acyltransferase DltB (MBOAT superfamily)